MQGWRIKEERPVLAAWGTASNIMFFQNLGAASVQPCREVFCPAQLFPASLSGLLLMSPCVSPWLCSEGASVSFALQICHGTSGHTVLLLGTGDKTGLVS